MCRRRLIMEGVDKSARKAERIAAITEGFISERTNLLNSWAASEVWSHGGECGKLMQCRRYCEFAATGFSSSAWRDASRRTSMSLTQVGTPSSGSTPSRWRTCAAFVTTN